MAKNSSSFTPADTAILLIDHQPGVLRMVGSLPAEIVKKNVATLARLGEQMGLPLIITTTREDKEFLGTTIEEVQTAAPNAYAGRIRRDGSLNAFGEAKFINAVSATRRRNLVIAGLTTDVCLSHSVTSALAAGYDVQVVADASGSGTTLSDIVFYDRFRSMGAAVTSTFGILFELYPDLSTAEGQKAQGVAAKSMAPA